MLTIVFFGILFFGAESINLNIRTKNRYENVIIPHFWKNTGLCPASDPDSRINFLLSEDEKMNFLYIGALPNNAISAVRIHWMLDLVTVKNSTRNNPVFEFVHLDHLIDQLRLNSLTPNFELMGNPSNYFHDFKTQSKHWIHLIEQIVKRYSDIYGASYVNSWKFELMNEPDLKQYNFLNFTLETYIDYFRACETAAPNIAGPAGLFRDNRKAHSLCWGLLGYCNLNPCNLNLITFHRKGGGVGSKVVEEGLELINSLISDYPYLKGIPFGNDEADIMKGWQEPLEWRADVRYAALAVQVIIGHIEQMLIKRNILFEMLSNDNAFLSFSPNYFTQRTLLARFQMNNTNPKHIQFFKKPIYSVMGLLSLLGNHLKDIRYHPGVRGFSYLVTRHKYQDTFLGVITNDIVKNETYSVSETSYLDLEFKMVLGNFSFSGISVGYIIDNINTNPYQVWRDAGSPDFPDSELRRKMRKAEGFRTIFIGKVKPYENQIRFVLRNLLIPSILCFNVCFDGAHEPGPVKDLRYVNVTRNEILLVWKDTTVNSSRCLLTYVVEFKGTGDERFQRINGEDSIFLSHHFDGILLNGSSVGVAGEYRVAAVDYWNRVSPYSDTLVLWSFQGKGKFMHTGRWFNNLHNRMKKLDLEGSVINTGK